MLQKISMKILTLALAATTMGPGCPPLTANQMIGVREHCGDVAEESSEACQSLQPNLSVKACWRVPEEHQLSCQRHFFHRFDQKAFYPLNTPYYNPSSLDTGPGYSWLQHAGCYLDVQRREGVQYYWIICQNK